MKELGGWGCLPTGLDTEWSSVWATRLFLVLDLRLVSRAIIEEALCEPKAGYEPPQNLPSRL